MTKSVIQKAFIFVASILLAALFIYASAEKLLDYSNFRFGLSESPLISSFAGIFAWMIPSVELILAVALLWPRTRLIALYLSFILLSLFTFYIAGMLIFGSDIPCSCGGVLEEMSWPLHILFNGAFIVLAGMAIFLHRKRKRLQISIS